MSTYATRRLYAKGCENTERRATENASKLTRYQNIEKMKMKTELRSFDTEARQRDGMRRHWDMHRQNLCTVQDKYTQFNHMWAARDDLYRKRREESYQRRIRKYMNENEQVSAQTEEFFARRDRILLSGVGPETCRPAGDSALQQKEMLERKILMTNHSRNNEVELFRYRDQNPTMFVCPPLTSNSLKFSDSAPSLRIPV